MAKSDSDRTKELDELHKQAKSAKRYFEPEWFMDLAFMQNKQWLLWSGGQLHKPNLSGNRITVVENRITGVVQTELAKMTKNRPVFVVTPDTGDEEDLNASKLGEQLMRYLWNHLKMHENALKALEWSRVCGAGFLKCYWDSTIGSPVDVLVGPDGQVVSDPQSGQAMRGDQQMAQMFSQQFGTQVRSKRIAQGDIKVGVRSPFQMFVDPICDSFPDAEWVIEESIKSKEYVLRRYGDVANKLKLDATANPGLVEGRMMGANPMSSGSYKGIRLREYWCKPSSEYPNGCRTVWAQGKVLEEDSQPFDPMPYVMLTGVPVPGRLWPMSVVELLRGPQTELNKAISQMAENRNRVGNPTLMYNLQEVRDPEEFRDATMMPGGTYPATGMLPINQSFQYLAPPPLPEYVQEEPQRNVGAIEDISGQHEVTNANVPPGVTAASAITLLQEADNTRLGLAIQDYEEQIGRFGTKLLKLVGTFYSDTRLIKIAGDDGAWEIFDFKGSQLRGNTTVSVQAGSAFPQSEAQKQAAITDIGTFLVQSGNAPHGRQMSQFLIDAGMGAQARLVSEYTVNEQQVNRENTLLSLGQQLGINDYDNDQAHIDGHTDEQKSARYAQFSPQVQQGFEQHVALHRQRLDQIQQQQLALQAQMNGQSPPGQPDPQQAVQMAQGDQQLQAGAQQQGFDAAGAEQQQRQQEESHQASQLSIAQRQRLELEKHHQQMQHAEEQHQARLAQIKAQARQTGASNGRENR